MPSKWDDIQPDTDLDAEFDRLNREATEDDELPLPDEEEIAQGEPVFASDGQGAQRYDPPALKSSDAANLRDLYPFLGYAWRELSPELRREALVWLREWVDWFAPTYKLDSKLISGCWFQHSDVVEYLWVAANAEMKAWHNPDASLTPYTSFHAYLPGLLSRLANGSHRNCRGVHVPDDRYGKLTDPNAVEVDEQAWQQTLNEITDVLPDPGAGVWRLSAVDADGTIYRSADIEVPAASAPFMEISEPTLGFDGQGRPCLRVEISGVELAKTYWEYKGQGGTWITDELSIQKYM